MGRTYPGAAVTARALALLARISDDLVGTLNAPAAVGRIPQLIVPALASWATVALLDEDGSLREVSFQTEKGWAGRRNRLTSARAARFQHRLWA